MTKSKPKRGTKRPPPSSSDEAPDKSPASPTPAPYRTPRSRPSKASRVADAPSEAAAAALSSSLSSSSAANASLVPAPKKSRGRPQRVPPQPARRSARIMARVPDTRCHVNRLPNELLIMVLKEVQKLLKRERFTLEPSIKTTLRLAHVCQKWRGIMRFCPPIMSLYSVFDDRREDQQNTVSAVWRSTITAENLSEFMSLYKVREMASFVFAGMSKEVYDFNLVERSKPRRELDVQRLWFLGLNHMSAQFLLTNDFTNLQYLSFMYTQLNHITQIASHLRKPLICSVLSLDGVTARNDLHNLCFWEDPRDLCVLHSLAQIQLWIHFKHLRLNNTALAGLPLNKYYSARQICTTRHKDHVREFQTTRNKPPPLETLGVWEFSAVQLREIPIDLCHLKHISVEVSRFDFDRASVPGRALPRKWEENFWSWLLRAGKNLERVAISGIKKEDELLDLAVALRSLGEGCKISMSKAVPTEVMEALREQAPGIGIEEIGVAKVFKAAEEGK